MWTLRARRPFIWLPKFITQWANKVLDGSYEVLWAAPDRYRLELRLGSVGETDVVLGNEKYVASHHADDDLGVLERVGAF